MQRNRFCKVLRLFEERRDRQIPRLVRAKINVVEEATTPWV